MPRAGRYLYFAGQALVLVICAALLLHGDYPARLIHAVLGTSVPVTQTPHYRQMRVIHTRHLGQIPTGEPVPIGFAGDSIIEGWLLPARLPGALNLGVGRDTVDGLLARISPDTVQKAQVWYLAIGINDVLRGHDPAALPDQIAQMARRFGTARHLFWQEALPFAPPHWTPSRETHRLALNAQIRTACAQAPNCTFVPAPADYVDRLADLTSDGLHPNARGYTHIQRHLAILLDTNHPTRHHLIPRP